MNYKIVIIDEAKIDFRESFFWYKNINPKLAKRYQLSFKESLEIIKKNPFHFQIFQPHSIFLCQNFLKELPFQNRISLTFQLFQQPTLLSVN